MESNEEQKSEPQANTSEENVDAVKDLMKALSLEQEAVEKYKGDALRAIADLDNYRKRVVREKDELRKMAAAGIIEQVLPVVDNMGLGLSSVDGNADGATVAKGFEMVFQQLKGILSQNGLIEVNPVEAAFDPQKHEAVSTQYAEGVEAGQVLEVVRVGYELNGRLLRPASVVVSKESPEA